jgi:hypothetical protein
MTIIYEIIDQDGNTPTEYFTSEADAIAYAYAELGAVHDYEFMVVARDVPAEHFTPTPTPVDTDWGWVADHFGSTS